MTHELAPGAVTPPRLAVPPAPPVAAVPDTVTYGQYMAAIRSLGIDPERVMSMHLHMAMIVCSVMVCDEQGNPTLGVDDQVLTRPAVVRVVGGP